MARIQTPDQRVGVFISSTMRELAAERAAVRDAVAELRLTPILFELGARPHPPKELYLAYLHQSHVFLGIYWQQYGWIAPGETVSGLEDEYLASGDKPRLVYVKSPAPDRDPRLAEMLDRIANEGLSYRRFSTPEELAGLVADDLAVLLSERFGPPDEAEELPPAVPARRSAHLPAPANRFVGRGPERAELRRLLTSDDVRLVTLVGPGGIGKTRLAMAVAAELAESIPDGVLPVLLAAVREAELVPAAIATELGLPETFGRSPLDAVVGIHNAPGARSWERFAADADNIRAALARFRGTGEPDRVAGMGEGLWPIWWGWSVFDEGIGWMEAALADPALSVEGRAVAEYVRGSLSFGHGDPATTIQALQEARRLHEQLGDEVRAASDGIFLGVAVSGRDVGAGERLEHEAVDVLRREGQPWKLAFALFALGRVLVVSGRAGEALGLLEESVRIQRSEPFQGMWGSHPRLGYALVNLGWAHAGLGGTEAARRAFRQALAATGNADRQAKARALEGLAAVALQEGDARLGTTLFGGAEAVRRSIGVGVWLTDQSSHADTETNLRVALGPSAFDAAFEEGLLLPPEDLVALACAPVSRSAR